MPLILAIVADPLEAAQLAQLIQGRLSVDLVQAAEVGEGLLALDDRIPDLILTSPLMSPFDDGVLDEYLRDLGPAGTHVQTLRIPVLSQAPKKKPRLGFSLRRSKPEPITPQGCEPKVFADEIEHYLVRAAEEKRHAVANEISPVMPREETMAPAPIEEEWSPAYGDGAAETPAWRGADSTPVYVPDVAPTYTPDPPAAEPVWSASAPEPEANHVVWRADLLDRPPVEEVPPYEPVGASAALDEVDQTPAYVDDPAPAPTRAFVIEPAEPEAQTAAMAPPAIETPPLASSSLDEPPLAPSMIDEPIVEEVVPQRVTIAEVQLTPAPTTDAVNEHPAVVSGPVAPINEDVAPVYKRAAAAGHDDAIKSTPSFKAALAAIRAAWGKPARQNDPPSTEVRNDVPTASNRIATPEAALEEEDDELLASAAEVSTPVEVDLTGAVEMLDEGAPHAHALESTPVAESWVPEPPPPSSPLKPAETEADYEPALEPDQRALESRLFAPLSPSRKQESASTSAPSAPPLTPRPSEEKRRTESSGERRMKKKRGSKGAKEKAARQQAEPEAQTQAVQDEWGMFDPNRCGFAALVDKLEKVADEKTEQLQKGNKVRVISYS